MSHENQIRWFHQTTKASTAMAKEPPTATIPAVHGRVRMRPNPKRQPIVRTSRNSGPCPSRVIQSPRNRFKDSLTYAWLDGECHDEFSKGKRECFGAGRRTALCRGLFFVHQWPAP